MVTFFRGLKRNNRREWFQPRKRQFEEYVRQPMVQLVEALNLELAQFAPEHLSEPQRAIFRIYRDTRFSSDKTPYKTHIAAWFPRRGAGRSSAGGFYFSVSSDQIQVAGGIYHPDSETMLLVRAHIAVYHEELRRILARRQIRRLLGELQGDELSRAPKGYPPEHAAIDLIKKKDWILEAALDPGLATKPKLFREIADRFRAMTPFIEFLNRPLNVPTPAKRLRDFLD